MKNENFLLLFVPSSFDRSSLCVKVDRVNRREENVASAYRSIHLHQQKIKNNMTFLYPSVIILFIYFL